MNNSDIQKIKKRPISWDEIQKKEPKRLISHFDNQIRQHGFVICSVKSRYTQASFFTKITQLLYYTNSDYYSVRTINGLKYIIPKDQPLRPIFHDELGFLKVMLN